MSESNAAIWRWRVAISLWVIASIALYATIVGLIDRVAPSTIGTRFLVGGGGATFVCGVLALLLRPRRPRELTRFAVVTGGTMPFAMFILFIVWRIGISAEQRHDCEQGVATQCTTLGERRQRRTKVEDAVALYRRGCELGDVEGCYRLASMLEFGVGTTEDRAGARSLYAQACDADIGNACLRLAQVLRADGDQTQSTLLYRRACDLGVVAACGSVTP